MRVCSVCQYCYDDEINYCSNEDHPPLTDLRTGTSNAISGYRLERLVATKREIELYEALHIDSGRTCLIKILAESSDDADKFLQEAQTAASLIHPKVADIYETGTLDDRRLYVVAELVVGKTVREILNEDDGSPDLLTTIRIVSEAAEALHAIHLKGLVHRAIRPENIVVSNQTSGSPSVKIQNIDFGGVIQRSIVSDKFTIDRSIAYLRYFAPEQSAGEPVGIKADVYALGVVLYEMLAGRVPFNARSAAALIEKHRSQRPPDIRIDNFDLRMLTTHSLMESLCKLPEERQSSANAVARQLRHVIQLATHVSTPPPAGAAPPWPQRSPALIGASIKQNVLVSTAAAAAATASELNLPASAVPSFQPVTYTDTHPTASAEIFEAAAPTADYPPASSHTRMKRRIRKLHAKLAAFVPAQLNAAPTAEPAAFKDFSPTPSSPKAIDQVSCKAATKLEWSQPEDDIPSVEAVIAELSESGVQLPDFTEPVVDIGNVIAADLPVHPDPLAAKTPADCHEVRKPMTRKPGKTLIEPLPESKSGSVPIPLPVSIPVSIPVPVPARAAVAAASGAGPRSIAAMSAIDPEEITVVTASRSKPIRINISSSGSTAAKHAPVRQTIPQVSSDVLFFPTLLGGFDTGRPDHAVSDPSMLSLSNTLSALRSVLSGGTLMVVCGLVAVASVFFFGNQFIPGVSSSDRSTVAGTATTTSQPAAPSQFAPVATSKKTPAKIVEAPKTAAVDVESNSKTSSPLKDQPGSKDKKNTVVQNLKNNKDKKTAVPVVQNSKNGSTKIPLPAPYTQTRTVEKKPALNTVKPTGTTRPRIVKNPKP